MRLGCSFIPLQHSNVTNVIYPATVGQFNQKQPRGPSLELSPASLPRTGRAEQNGSNAFPYTGDCIIRLRAGGHGYTL